MGGLDKIPSGPTRGAATLDVIYTNALGFLQGDAASTFPPLESEDGLISDHKSVWAALRLKKERNYEWVKVKVRLRSEIREQAFKGSLSSLDWSHLESMGLNEAVTKFEETIGSLTDHHFPLKTFLRRSNEKPWITNRIRKKSKKKRMIFRKRGRSASWRALARDLEQDVQESKKAFVEDAIQKGGNGNDFYAVVKKLSGPGTTSTVKGDGVLLLHWREGGGTAHARPGRGTCQSSLLRGQGRAAADRLEEERLPCAQGPAPFPCQEHA